MPAVGDSPYRIAAKETILATDDARATLMTLAPGQSPLRHAAVTDTAVCLSGLAKVVLPDTGERLTPGERACVRPPGRTAPSTAGCSLVQGPGSYDFLTSAPAGPG